MDPTERRKQVWTYNHHRGLQQRSDSVQQVWSDHDCHYSSQRGYDGWKKLGAKEFATREEAVAAMRQDIEAVHAAQMKWLDNYAKEPTDE